MSVQTRKLSNGVEIPLLAFGVGSVWNKPRQIRTRGADVDHDELRATLGKETVAVLEAALAGGFTHIDTAEGYETEPEVGEVLAQQLQQTEGSKRSDFFVTTKIFPKAAEPEKALETSLQKLGLDYVDLYLVHLPFLSKAGTSIDVLWPKLEKLYDQGKIRALGVSNFNVDQLTHLQSFARVQPTVNQVEYHPYYQDFAPGLLEYATANNIVIESFGSLGAVTTAEYETAPLTPLLKQLAAKYDKTPAQINLKWIVQQGIVAVTTSSKTSRIKELADVFDFELTPDELAQISKIGETYKERRHPIPLREEDVRF